MLKYYVAVAVPWFQELDQLVNWCILCFIMFKGQPDGQHVPAHNQYDQESEQNLVKTRSNLDYDASENDQILRVNELDSNINRGLDADSIPSANGDGKVYNS